MQKHGFAASFAGEFTDDTAKTEESEAGPYWGNLISIVIVSPADRFNIFRVLYRSSQRSALDQRLRGS